MSYAQALKKYFADKGVKASFPKKGSAEHSEIRAMMESGDLAASGGTVSQNAALEAGQVKKPRASKKKLVAGPTPAQTLAEEAPIKPDGTTLIDTPGITKKSVAAVKKTRKPKAVQSDGLTPQQNLLNKDTVENASMAVAPAAFPGLKEQLEKVLEKVPEGVAVKKERKPRITKALGGDKSIDMPALEARAPFSFAAIRQILRQ